MSFTKVIRRVAIVGTGVTGASWATHYLSRGFDVVATDPAPNAESDLRNFVDEAWAALASVGMAPGASAARLRFVPNLEEALTDADFVQENGPEHPDLKVKLFAEMDAAAPADSILASSSSGIPMDVIQSACTRPERCVIGHPFNPAHIVPLVEAVGWGNDVGSRDRACAGLLRVCKKPIRLRKALTGIAYAELPASNGRSKSR